MINGIIKIRLVHKLVIALFFMLLLSSLHPYHIYLLVIFSLVCWIVLPNKRGEDHISILLLVFSFLYDGCLLLNGTNISITFIAYAVAPAILYKFGRWLLTLFKSENARQILLFFVLVAYLLPLFHRAILDALFVGLINTSRQMTIGGDVEFLTATLYGLMASFGLGCAASFFTREQKYVIKMGYILLFLLSLFVIIHLINRTGVVVVLFCFIFIFFLTLKSNIKSIISALLIMSIVVFLLDSSGLIDADIWVAYELREAETDTVSAGGRTDIWLNALSNFIVSPFGWENSHLRSAYGYAHNLWLDIARLTGWFPFIAFVCATFLYLKKLMFLVKKVQGSLNLLLLSINLSLLLSSSVEPVIEGSFLFFSLMMIIWGMTVEYSNQEISKGNY